ncbi:hypothetical protein VU07_02370 [Desulfobulbus sp. F4]|nr:hypothetical protein [Desulfobulbus sp. F4]
MSCVQYMGLKMAEWARWTLRRQGAAAADGFSARLVSMEAVSSSRPVLDVLMQQPEVAGAFQREEIEQTISPEKHIGMAKELSSRTIAFVQGKMQELPEIPAEDARICPLCAEGGCKMRC